MNIWITVAIGIGAAVIGVISAKYLGDDNQVEEACEEIIEKETGKQVDLTPSSQEKAEADSQQKK